MKILKKHSKKKEDGQSMLEFVLVLPVFLLLLFFILDSGWLFYNLSNVSNAARNAARIACVEYENSCADIDALGNKQLLTEKEYDFSSISSVEDIDSSTELTEDEKDILKQVINTLNLKDGEDGTIVKVVYSGGATINERMDGDVTVTVSHDVRTFTMIFNIGSDGLDKTLTSSSTFKVEKNGDTYSNDD